MKKLFLTILACIFIVYVILYTSLLSVSTTAFISGNTAVKTYKDREYALLKFIEKHFSGGRGEIYTVIRSSRKDKKNALPELTDKNTLSESVGLFMNYCIIRNRKDLFDREFIFLTGNLMYKDRFVRWKTGSDISCNALIDDLRIVRALLDAYDKWGERKYFDTAGFIQEEIYKNQVTDSGIYELYDWNSNKRKNLIPLCYIDLYTLDRAGIFNSGWAGIADKGLNTVKQGKIGKYSPFFYKYYNYETGLYTADEEFEKNGAVCITYSIYTALHLIEVNEDTEDIRNWFRNQIDGGKLFAWYSPVTLKEVGNIESTAVYALAAIFSKKTGDNELYCKFIERMLDFMITDRLSPYYGGFGDLQTGEFYAFDNLTALWALALVDD